MGYQPDVVAPCTYNPLSSSLQPVLVPVHHELTYPTVSQLVQKDAVRGSIKCLAEIQKNNIHHLLLIYTAGDLIIKGYQASYAELPGYAPVLTVPDDCIVFIVKIE